MNSIRNVIAAFLILLSSSIFGQEPFAGKLVYQAQLQLPDTGAVLRKWYVTVYTNDTIVRTETSGTQFGDQVYIRHLELNKAYLLLDWNGEKYAIQNDLSKRADTVKPAYSIKKVSGRKTIHGIKAKRYRVIYNDLPQRPFDVWMAKKIPGKYVQAYPETGRLPLEYTIPTEDGFETYTLIGYIPGAPNRDLFGLPSDYKRVSYEEFMEVMTVE